ncbi:GH92 family glycosyl hydrolase [Oerskovia flava]|uniref:GH92 family glycosyl hydrolase n=1 Tax=Oerskovia flava TaxID=2986422 RepID=UPI00223FE66B|nr:GH92 family glycosyl hydrolase [Oerskovia sp. JB1-3-2]
MSPERFPRGPARTRSHPRRLTRTPLALALATALVTPLALTATAGPASAAPGDLATGFEQGDLAPLGSTVAERPAGTPWQENVTGDASLLPGSVLGSLEAVTASAQNLPNEGAANLADGNPGTKWLAFAATGWVAYEFSEPVTVSAYSLSSANDAAPRDPAAWQLQGSVDGSTWTTVDERSGEAFEGRLQTRVFELDEPVETAYTHYRLTITANVSGSILQLGDWDLSADLDAEPVASPMVTTVGSGPASVSWTNKTNVGLTGVRSLRYAGSHLDDGAAHATNVLLDDVEVQVGPETRLSYGIFPEFLDDLQYPSTHTAVDLRFTDGTYLSDLGARDVYGTDASPRGQGEGKILYADQWNSVRVDVGAVAEGKTVDQVLLGYDNPGGDASTRFAGWLDDVALTAEPETIDDSSRTHFVDTRRGTFSSGSFSRGNNIPATAVPNGFNFWVPMTNASSQSWLYEYQKGNDAQNRPVLQGLGISHEPSPWMGDRNQLAFLPADGASATPSATLSARGLSFDHADETAQPDYYGVTFTNGIELEVAPSDHGAVLRFTYETDAGQVLVDRVAGDANVTLDPETGELTGWVDNGSGLSAGRSRMFVAGTFDRSPTATGDAAGNRTGARYATFDTSSERSVELRVATSFISLEQARANRDLEVTGRSFDDVRADAQAAWNDRLAVIDVEGASEDQLVTLYSNLYRLNLYPNSQFENVGTADAPEYAYASPVAPRSGSATATETNAEIVEGKIYVNNGFWDTYRTAWPAYSLLYPELASELVDGFVQHYRDGGWIARWSSPGYADLMTGTSSDVSFADAYVKGSLPTDVALEAYDAALKNATVLPPNNAVGRKGLDRSIFLGFTESGTHESPSWGLEGFINDFGIGNMAAALAEDPETPADRRAQLAEEAQYFLERATHFTELFDPEVDFFQQRRADGSFVLSPEQYDPEDWGNGYTETNGWNFAFHAPQDGQGLANLYGGKAGLEEKLDEFFSTPEQGAGSGGIHEQREARDVRMGQWGMSNQVSHHIPFLYAAAGAPAKMQEKTREVQRRLFTGNDLGQGYPGDEDNGEMSAWWLFTSLGLYPAQVGSDQYVLTSPLFDKATVKLPDGDLVVNAAGNSQENVYVQSLEVDGVPHTSTSISQEALTGGTTLDFVMGAEPSAWGTGEGDAPPSLTEGDEPPHPVSDVTTPGLGTLASSDGADVRALVDNTSRSEAELASDAVLTWTAAGLRPTVTSYTLTSGADGATPSAWTLEGSVDGESWTTLDERSDEEFRWGTQTRPFLLADPGAYTRYRLAVTETAGEGALTLAEVELLADPTASGATELTLTAASDLTARTGAEVDARFATLSGSDGDVADLDVQVTFGDGSDAVAGELTPVQFGGYAISAPHTWTAPGVYPVTVTVTEPGDDGGSVSATLLVDVELLRAGSLEAAFDSRCIGEVGAGASCDGAGVAFDREQLAEAGFVQGERGTVPGTELQFDVPAVAPGQPDNALGEGQTIDLDVPDDATQLSVIGTGTEKNQVAEGLLTFDDGSTAPIDLSFGDWTGAANAPQFGNVRVALTANRLAGGNPTSLPAAIFATAPLELPEGKQLVSLTLPEQPGTLAQDGRIHVFAIAHDGAHTDHEALAVEAAEALEVEVGARMDDVLATVTGGRADGYRAAITWGDGSDVVPGTVGAADGEGAGQVTGDHVYDAPGAYTVHVVVDDGWTSSAVSLPVTVTEAEPALAVEVTARAQCLGSKVHLGVRAQNLDDVPLRIEIVTPYGQKIYADVAPGKNGYQAFNTRAASIEAGTATVVATATVDGEEITREIEVAYEAVSCG